jgi:8-oxo-dGTP pyrophosphatase MutT (NUDIX family)
MKQVAVGIISRMRIDGSEEYLLVSSTKNFGEYTGFYYPPGGHVEDGENIKQALIREIYEELKLQIRPIEEIVITPGDVPEQETHWWKCELIAGNIVLQKTEIADAGFFYS